MSAFIEYKGIWMYGEMPNKLSPGTHIEVDGVVVRISYENETSFNIKQIAIKLPYLTPKAHNLFYEVYSCNILASTEKEAKEMVYNFAKVAIAHREDIVNY